MRRKISHAVFFQSTTWYITLSLQVLIEFEQKIPKGTEAQDSKITCNNILVQDWVITENMSLDFSPHQTFFNNYVGSNNLCSMYICSFLMQKFKYWYFEIHKTKMH